LSSVMQDILPRHGHHHRTNRPNAKVGG